MSPRTPRSTKISTETRLGRSRNGTREERSTFLVLCEGKTEKDYFAGMRSRRGPQIEVDVPKGDHLAKVREAVDRVSSDYDAVWCILDTELDEELTAEMTREAGQSSVKLGLSTPCFELWLILHHVDCTRPFQSADAAKKKLKKIIPSWSEKNTRFADFADGVDTACDRARRLDPDGKEQLKNPSSNVWQLMAALQADSKQADPNPSCD
ncbi:RloB family protein [Streptosporangium lutulentum]|nr:RloB family protein [Streptosporangium lutulentum]